MEAKFPYKMIVPDESSRFREVAQKAIMLLFFY
jgi:hypothetical protein